MKEERPVNITLTSFGFKYSRPNANYYFDVGFIKNPARETTWDFFSRPTDEMKDYVLKQEATQKFISYVVPLIIFLAEVDQYQIFAFGCNSGRHRSFILVEEVQRKLEKQGIKCKTVHQNMED